MSDIKSEFRDLAAELKNLIASNDGKVDNMSSEVKEQYDKLNERLDALEFDVKNVAERKPQTEAKAEIVDQFKDAFIEFSTGDRKSLTKMELKSGYAREAKSSMVRFDFASAGALLLPAQVSADIIKDVIEFTPLLGLVRVTPTNRSNYQRRVRTSTPGGTWLEEVGATEAANPTYATIDIPPHKWAAEYAWSIEMQQDSGYDLISEITQAYREDSRADIGNKLLLGDGIKKPTGMVGRIGSVDSAALTISTNDLIKMQEELKEDYQSNASWLFTRKTRAAIRTRVLSTTNGLQYTWEPDFQRRTPTLLLGAPIAIAAEGDLAGNVEGTFTAGQVPIIYGDFRRGYEVAMHTDMYVIDNPYTKASSFERSYHIMSRIGGNVIQSEALVQLTAAGS
jgi:HK97 family phage major capsid protein